MTVIEQAAQLGKEAFEAGKMRVPVLDPALLKLLADNRTADTLAVLQAWVRAWDAANLKAEV